MGEEEETPLSKKKKRKLRQEAKEAEDKARDDKTKVAEEKEKKERSQQAADPDAQGRQRKRKKKRSKQKNILKDTRTTKPDHLQVGSEGYAGRELSNETRKKLGLPTVADPSEVSWSIDPAGTDQAAP